LSSIDFQRSHSLAIQEAREAVSAIAAELTRELDITCGWEGDTLRFQRTGARGTIQVADGIVHFHADLSLLLRPLKSTIEAKVQQYFDRYFEHPA
jgi:putative polyhydroxyalkanoate system protein